MNHPVSGCLRVVILLCAGIVVSCGRQPPEQSAGAAIHYTLGHPWQSQGYWFYPTEELSYDTTGLAVVDVAPGRASRATADGEAYDPAGLTGAHQTLQLPVILRVRNLENGREISLRVNDRGPAFPGRLISVTPYAARLLGMVTGQATRVQVSEDEKLSRDLLQHVMDAPRSDLAAAPVMIVQEQSLMPAGAKARPDGPAPLVQGKRNPGAYEQPPGVVTQWPANPGQLWVDAGHFSQASYAYRLATRLNGQVRPEGRGRSAVYAVRVGPFDLPAAADVGLDRARLAGVTGARIIVE